MADIANHQSFGAQAGEPQGPPRRRFLAGMAALGAGATQSAISQAPLLPASPEGHARRAKPVDERAELL